MKNARGRGRGGFGFSAQNNNNQRRNPPRMSNKGPLMTEHLQHIDLELDLLKRKREMIEQQQELLETQMMHREKTLHYESPRYFERPNFQSTSNLDNDYTRYYDEPVGSAEFMPHNSRKRSYQPEWEVNPAPNKRFTGSVRGGDRKYGARSGPSNNQFQGQGSRRPPPRESRFDYSGPARPRYDDRPRSGRVTKPKTSAPNKTLAERATDKASTSATYVDKTLVLRPNVPMSNQLQGRLELLMGHLLKELKTRFGETDAYREVLQNPLTQRTVKQLLRDRIKELMMNKYIGPINAALPPYRKRYPESTDEALLEEVKQTKLALHKNPENKLVQSDDPKEFLEVNMQNLVQTKLSEMFKKLEKLYRKSKQQKDILAPREHKIVIKKEDEDKAEETPENEKKAEVTEAEKTEEETLECENKEGNAETVNKVEENEKTEIKVDNGTEESEEMVSVKDIEIAMAKILHKFVPRLTRLLKVNTAFEATRSFLLQIANQKLAHFSGKQRAEKSTPEQTVEVNETEIAEPLPAAYFVKILGKPQLPKRKIMQSFLDKFRPRSVKRHKRIRNLLFVGFQREEEADKILAEDGHTMGKIKLTIRRSDKSNMTKQDGDGDDDEIVKEEETSALEVSQVESEGLGSELDDQISDLLSSIREAEENNDKNGDEDWELNNKQTDVTNTVTDDNVETTGPIETENKEKTEPIIEKEKTEPIIEKDKTKPIIEKENKDNDTEKAQENGSTTEANPTEMTVDETPESKEPIEENTETTVEPITEDAAIVEEKKDVISNLKSETPATPTRASARIANTPSAIRTRRTSRLNANDKS